MIRRWSRESREMQARLNNDAGVYGRRCKRSFFSTISTTETHLIEQLWQYDVLLSSHIHFRGARQSEKLLLSNIASFFVDSGKEHSRNDIVSARWSESTFPASFRTKVRRQWGWLTSSVENFRNWYNLSVGTPRKIILIMII